MSPRPWCSGVQPTPQPLEHPPLTPPSPIASTHHRQPRGPALLADTQALPGALPNPLEAPTVGARMGPLGSTVQGRPNVAWAAEGQ